MGMIWVGYRRSPELARRSLEDDGLLEQLLEADDDETSVDLDKAWHGIHWLLTGSAEPTDDVGSDAVFGGDALGGDLGQGPGRLLPATRVGDVAAALRALGPEALGLRMDPAAMTDAGLYPEIWDEEDVYDVYLRPAYESLRAFYAAAADAGESVIQTIC